MSGGDSAVDATVGNGVDTLFLSRRLKPGGTVYGFDIQAQALEQARKKMAGDCAALHLFNCSHSEMAERIPAERHGKIAAVMFNLGYLPGADHSVITKPETTVPALNAALSLLKKGGIVTVIVYSGHPGGESEAKAVDDWAANLPQEHYQVLSYRFLNQKNNPPYLIAVEKR